MVKHFRFLYDLQTLIPESEMAAIFSDARPGTLLQMLHSQLHEEPEAQYDMYEKFIERSKVRFGTVNYIQICRIHWMHLCGTAILVCRRRAIYHST